MRHLLPLLLWAPLAAATIDLPCTGDTSIVLYQGEEAECHGAKPWIRLKGNQHLLALGFDAAPLRGKLVRSAWLETTAGEAAVRGVSVSTIAVPWREATANALGDGVLKDGWGVAGVRFPAVCGGNAGTLVTHGLCRVEDGRYRWEVGAELVQQLALGLAHGLAVQEYDSDYSRNPTIRAREGGGGAVLHVEVEDALPGAPLPAPVTAARITAGDWCPLLRVKAPDQAFAWEVQVDGRPLPRWNLPACQPGRENVILLRDLPAGPGVVMVAVLDRLGRSGPSTQLRMPPATALPTLPDPVAPAALGPGWDGIQVLPALDALHADGKPVGAWTPALANEVSDGRAITLRAASGETVCFQLAIRRSGLQPIAVELPGCVLRLSRALPVASSDGSIGDPLIPCTTVTVAPGTVECVLVEVDVGAGAAQRQGRCTVGATTIPIELRLRPFALPARPGFACEMNGYGLPDSVAEYAALQAAAALRRCHVNLLPYGHRTAAPGARTCVMDMRLPDGRRMDEARFRNVPAGEHAQVWWDDFATAFGATLGGAHPPRGFYLPVHESFPLPMRAFWNGDLDAQRAFSAHPEYRATLLAVLRDVIAQARQRKWDQAGLQYFLNNKGDLADLQKNPWTLDEPTSWWDYRALAFYGAILREARGTATSGVLYRIDISRPEFDRGLLTGIADLWVVAADAARRNQRLLAERSAREGLRLWEYGSTSPVEASPRQTWLWAIDAFARGADGVVPWQTINSDGAALSKADQLGILIADRSAGDPPAIRVSRRLLAYQRAEQDIAYLHLVQERLHLDRAQLAALIAQYVSLDGQQQRRSEEDAGTAVYAQADALSAHRLREALAQLLAP